MIAAVRSFAFALCVTLASCATQYQSSGFSGGFHDAQLADNFFQISFHGNGFSSSDRVDDFALLRAAEVCLAHGYPYFVVMNDRDRSHDLIRETPATSETSGTIYSNGNGYGTINSSTTYHPAHTSRIHKPGIELTVKGLTVRPAVTFAYDAAALAGSLRATYNIN